MSQDPRHAAVLPRLLEIGRALAGEARLSDVLSRILDAAIEVTGAERGFLCLAEGDALRIAVARNLDQEEVQDAQRKLSQSVIRRVVQSGEPLTSIDAHQDPRLAESDSIHDMQIRSVVCIPLKLKPLPASGLEVGGPAVIGCVYLDHRFRTEAFAQAEVEFLEILGVYAALAIQAARLVEQLQKKNASLNLELEQSVNQLVQTQLLLKSALADAGPKHQVPGVVYASRAMHEILGLLVRVAEHDLPILFTGESGTGKELLARAVHSLSPRSRGPFVAVNCGAISPDLFESELFGHVKGAFTGADRDRVGMYEAAHQGTLFLDEVADLSLPHQVKLLRALQEGEVRRVGESSSRHFDVRVLSATNKNLNGEVREGRFREDLFYRLRVFHVDVPPLRERPEDIPLLVDDLIRRLHSPGSQKGRAGTDARAKASPAAVPGVDPEVYSSLSRYTWPGNIRELENEIRRALALSSGRITVDDLSPLVANAPHRSDSFPTAQPGGTLEEIVATVERQVILQTLERWGGNKSRTAHQLGISRNGLAMKMERLGLGG